METSNDNPDAWARITKVVYGAKFNALATELQPSPPIAVLPKEQTLEEGSLPFLLKPLNCLEPWCGVG
jgi:hypothetical protein